jgi:hypothetical protein
VWCLVGFCFCSVAGVVLFMFLEVVFLQLLGVGEVCSAFGALEYVVRHISF